MDDFEAQHPDWGMPFGLPGLEPGEEDLVARWLERGASDEGPAPLPPALKSGIADWEAFFNGDSLKQRLVARYLYEHLFVALLHFDSDPEETRFRLVRSSTPSGQPIQVVATRRPYDDPRIDRVYYRLDRVRESIVEKTDMPYVIGPERLVKLRAIFLDPPYLVVALPSYEVDVSSNPFVAFAAIPARVRYRFLLDEAQLTMMGFIKGPVCRGQLALNAIEDQFWVFFADPDADPRDLHFLVLLPRASLKRVRDFWYRGASDAVRNHVYGGAAHLDRETDIVYRTGNPKSELLKMLSARVEAAVDYTPTVSSTTADPALLRAIGALAGLRGASLSFLPETVILRIEDPGEDTRYFTILRNTGHSNVSNLFREDSRVVPAEHTLTVVPGFVGAYPNALYAVPSRLLKNETRGSTADLECDLIWSCAESRIPRSDC